VEPRHHEIRDDDRRTKRSDFLEGIFTVSRRVSDKSPALDELFKSNAGRGVVLDDQHAFGDGLWCGGFQQCHFYILSAKTDRRKRILLNGEADFNSSTMANSLQ